MNRTQRQIAILGSFDGTVTALGMLLSLAIVGNYKGLLIGAFTLAIGAAISMAGGEWLSQDKTNWKNAITMGIASFAGTCAPAVPLVLTHSWIGYGACGLIVIGMLAIIAHARPETFWKSFVRSTAVLVTAAGIATTLSFLL